MFKDRPIILKNMNFYKFFLISLSFSFPHNSYYTFIIQQNRKKFKYLFFTYKKSPFKMDLVFIKLC